MTEEVGAWAEGDFEGTSVKWSGPCSDKGGRVQVSLDGEDVAVVDQYNSQPGQTYLWQQTGLKPGKHLFRITLLDETNPASLGRVINVGDLVLVEPEGPSGRPD